MPESLTAAESPRRTTLSPRWARPLPVLLAITVLLPALGMALQPMLGLRALLFGVLFGLLPLILVVVCGVHEVGHVIGGWFAGFRFAGLFVGPLAISRDARGLRVQGNASWALVGGIAICVPPRQRIRDSRAALPFLAGGPVASALFGALLIALHFGFGLDDVTRRTIEAGQHTVTELVVGAVTFLLGVCSLMIAIVTLIPNRFGGFTSDGAAIRMLWQRSPDSTYWLTLLAVMGEAFDGVRPRDWSAEHVAQLERVDDSSPMASGCHGMALQVALDSCNHDGVRHHLARLKAAMHSAPAIAQASVRLDEAWYALSEGRVTDARAEYDAGAAGFVEEYVRCRVHAGVLLAEGHVERACAEARDGLRLLEDAPKPYPGLVIRERELLDALAAGQRVPEVGLMSTAA
jgi:hypothetical protein